MTGKYLILKFISAPAGFQKPSLSAINPIKYSAVTKIKNNMMPETLKNKMQKQGYHFVGNHSAIKVCEYTANALRGRELCYKNKFYGINTARCMQTSLSIGCDLSCRFCWRMIPEERNVKRNE